MTEPFTRQPRSAARLTLGESDESVWRVLATGRTALQEGRVEDARGRAQEALRLLESGTPTRTVDERRAAHGSAETLLGLAAETSGRDVDAVHAFRRALGAFAAVEGEVQRGVVEFCRGVALLHAERPAEAEDALHHAFELGEDTPDQRRYLGLALAAQHRGEEAFATLSEAVDRAPHDRTAWRALAEVADDLGHPAEQRAGLWLRAAQELADADDLVAALAAARRAYALEPGVAARLLLAALEIGAGDPDEARSLVDGIAEGLSEQDELRRISVLLALDRTDEAADAFMAAQVGREHLVWKVDVLLAAGRFDDALATIDAAAAQGLPVQHRRASALQGLGRDAEALEAARAAVEETPDDIEAYGLLADACLAMDDLPGASRALDAALTHAPQDVGLRTWRERLRAEEGDLASAARTLETLAAENPDDPYVHATCGVVLNRLGRPRDAATHLELAAADAPHVTWVWRELAGSYLVLGDPTQRERAWQHVVELEPADPYARLGLADAIVSGYSPDEPGRVAEILSDVLDDPRNADDATLLGRSHAALGEYHRRFGTLPDSLDELDQALALIPDNAYARGTRGQVLLALDRVAEAVVDLERAQTLYLADDDPPQASAPAWLLNELATAYERRLAVSATPELTTRAESTLRQLVDLRPDDAARWTRLASFLLGIGERGVAEQALRDAIAADAQPPATARRDLVDLLREDLRLDEALVLARAVADAEPDDVPARFTYGTVLVDVGRLDEGTAVLTDLAEIDGWLPAAAGALAGACTTRGDYGAALAWWDKAVEAQRSVWALAQRATLRRNAGDVAGADQDLGEALSLEPEDTADTHALASALYQAARFSEAAAHYARLEGTSPASSSVSVSRAACEYLAGDSEAISRIRRVVWRDPADTWSRYMLGALLVDSGDLDEGVEQLERTLQYARDEGTSRRFVTDLTARLVDALCEQGRVVEAWREALRVVRDDPDNPGAWYATAAVANQNGAWRTATRLARRGARCPTRLAALFREQGRAAEREADATAALAAYDSALGLEALDVGALRGRANALWLAGDLEAARAGYREVIAQLPNMLSRDRRASALAGWALFRLGEHRDAASALQDALSAMRFPANALFDLTLVALVAGSPSQASSFARHAAEAITSEPDAYRRGTLRGALADLGASRGAFPERVATAADDYERLLLDALEPLDSEITLPDDDWLRGELAD